MTTTHTSRPREPLYKIQARALESPEAARRAAIRWAEVIQKPLRDRRALNTSPEFQARLASAYLKGLMGEQNPWQAGRGGNFAEPLRDAFTEGHELREILAVGKGAPTRGTL